MHNSGEHAWFYLLGNELGAFRKYYVFVAVFQHSFSDTDATEHRAEYPTVHLQGMRRGEIAL